MRRWVLRRVGIAGLLAATAGCDSDSFAPPEAPTIKAKGSTSTASAMPARAREIVLVVPAADNADLQTFDLVARHEAGIFKVVYRMLRPGPGDPPSKQGELIKRAASEGASVVLVVPDASKETADALAAIDPRKTPVVLLGRSPSGSAPAGATLVTFPSFAVSARSIVGALAADAKAAGVPAGAPALLLRVAPADETSEARDAALNDALKAAKIPIAASVTTTDDLAKTVPVVEAAIEAHPDAFALVSDDESGVEAAAYIYRDKKIKRKLLMAGYYVTRTSSAAMSLGPTSAIVERNLDGLVRRAIRAGLDRAEGKSVPARIEVEMPERRGAFGATSAPPPVPKADPSPTPSKPTEVQK